MILVYVLLLENRTCQFKITVIRYIRIFCCRSGLCDTKAAQHNHRLYGTEYGKARYNAREWRHLWVNRI